MLLGIEIASPEGVIPEAVLEDARNADAFGVVLSGGDVVATFAALEREGTVSFPSTLADVQRIIAATPTLHDTKAISCTTRLIANSKCSRFEIELNRRDEAWRQLVYMLPGGDYWATLRVTAWFEHYERLATQLDALVATLPGIISQPQSCRVSLIRRTGASATEPNPQGQAELSVFSASLR